MPWRRRPPRPPLAEIMSLTKDGREEGKKVFVRPPKEGREAVSMDPSYCWTGLQGSKGKPHLHSGQGGRTLKKVLWFTGSLEQRTLRRNRQRQDSSEFLLSAQSGYEKNEYASRTHSSREKKAACCTFLSAYCYYFPVLPWEFRPRLGSMSALAFLRLGIEISSSGTQSGRV